jgi:hypothetical protein
MAVPVYDPERAFCEEGLEPLGASVPAAGDTSLRGIEFASVASEFAPGSTRSVTGHHRDRWDGRRKVDASLRGREVPVESVSLIGALTRRYLQNAGKLRGAATLLDNRVSGSVHFPTANVGA